MNEIFSGLDVIVTFRLIFVIAAIGHYLPLSINMLDVAIAGYMAVGAYTSAVLTRNFHLPFELAILAGGAVSSLFALVVDFVAARVKLKGFAFAIVTIGFAEIIRVLLINIDYLGGSLGFRQIQPHTTLSLCVAILLFIIIGLTYLKNSHIGRALSAIRDDEIAAEAMGINVLNYKLFTGSVGAYLGGLSGGLFAHYSLFLAPNQFGFDRLIEIQLPVVFGGLETFWGAIFGITSLGILPEILRPLYRYRLICYAVLTIFVLIYRPQGIITKSLIDRISSLIIRGLRIRNLFSVNGNSILIDTSRNTKTCADDCLLKIIGIKRTFGGLDALANVSLKVVTNSIHAIIGPNGAGKTTLFNIINGLLPATAGSILFGGIDISKLRSDQIAKVGIARTFQNVRIFGGLTVLENVQVGGHLKADVGFWRPFFKVPFKTKKSEIFCRIQAEALIDFVGLRKVKDRLAIELPLPEQRKLELARALACEPKLLLLDEQASGMNRKEKDEIFELIHKIVKKGMTILFVEHDMRIVMGNAHKVSVLNFGKLIAEGVPSEIKNNHDVIEAYLGKE